MRYRRLGKSGVQVSVIGLGTNQFGGKVDQPGVKSIVDCAIDAGVNFIDTANVYKSGRSEELLGKALRGKWDRVVVATKVYFKVGDGPNDRGSSRYHIQNEIEKSLRRLDTDHIDLYQLHRWDQETPIEESLRALDDLIRSGKVRYVGASAFAAWQLATANLLAEFRGWTPFVTIQSHYHMFERDVEKEVLPYCRESRVGFIPYFPLAGGFLTGKYRIDSEIPSGSRGESSPYVQRYMTAERFELVETLEQWASDYGRSMVELAHAWLLAEPSVCSVISGATSVDQLRQNVAASDWHLTSDEKDEVDKLLQDTQGQ